MSDKQFKARLHRDRIEAIETLGWIVLSALGSWTGRWVVYRYNYISLRSRK